MTTSPVINILLVSDEAAICLNLDSVADEIGARLVVAKSMHDALKQGLEKDFAAVLIDLDRLNADGLELGRMMRNKSRSRMTPIIFLAAPQVPEFSIEDVYALGRVDHLAKPLNLIILRTKLAMLVELHGKTQALAQAERARHCTALNVKNERIRLILQNAKGYAFIVADLQGHITEWEGGAQTIMGWPAHEIIGQPLSLIFTAEDRAAGVPQAELQKARMSGLAEYKRWHVAKNGSRFFAEGVMIPLKDGNDHLHGYAKVFRDATFERQAADEVRLGEEKLHESRGLFSLLLESSVEGIFGMRADSSCMFINAAGAAMLGYRADELANRKLHPLIHHHRMDGSIYPTAECRISAAVRDGVSVRIDDEVFWHKNGKPVPVAYSVSPMVVGGKSSGAVVTFSDITDRKRREAEREHLLKEVQTANHRMVEVFRQAPAFMCVLRGPDHVFEMVNERYLQLVGYRDPVGLPMRQALPELEGQGYFELLDNVFETGQSFTGTDMPAALQRKPTLPLEKRFVDLVYMALRDADEKVTGILIHGVDQTDRRLAELALRSSEERYRTLFESMDQGFCIIEMMFDRDGVPVDYRFLEMNGMFEKHSGIVNAVGKTIREIFPGNESVWFETYGRVALTGEPIRFENEAKAMNRWFDVFATPTGEPGSHKVAVLFSDITGRKKSEEDLRRLATDLAEADRRKTEFLATLAHELRNPLAPIRSGLGVLRMGGNNPATVAKIREIMDRQVNQMVHLIDDLLDIARISGGKVELKKERVGIDRVIASAIETSMPLIEAGGHELVVSMPDEALVVDADLTRLAHVLANLLNNAAKYTAAGGRIELSAQRDGNDVTISVADNGVGIPGESLASIFDMFKQVGRNMNRAQGGLGIGLTLVRRLVEMHGGTVVARSPGIDQGSMFTVRLALVNADAQTASAIAMPRAHEPSREMAAGLRVLVVDDNVDAAVTLSTILALNGYQTEVAHDGYQAVKAAQEFRPEVAFLDIGMPGMNGYETAQAMRKVAGLEKIVLIALTGWGDANDRAKSKTAGFDHHLTKPAELSVVDALLSQLVESRR